MKYDAHPKPSRRGFTLIELLVVMAIIAVLASILFSVLSGAKERARRTSCQSNLKELAIAMQQYVQDNNGFYPPHKERFNQSGIYGFGWSQAIFSYLKGEQVFSCPEMPANAPWHMGRKVGADNPDYNYDWGGLTVLPSPFATNKMDGVRESILVTPSSIWLNEDLGWSDSDGDHYQRIVPKTSCGQKGGGSTLHSGGGNYSYVDGHVKWLTPEEAGEVECANGPLPAPFKD